MKKLLITAIISLCALQSFGQAKNWAIGFKLGDPTGLNLRKYGEKTAFDVNIGTYGWLYGTTRDYRSGQYKSSGLSVTASYLWYTPMFGDNFNIYGGLGAQVNSRKYYPDKFSSVDAYVNTISLGVTPTAGMEYFVPYKPYSVFLEGGLYTELIPDIFFVHPQVGLGLRVNF
ncbi:hypothetical protein SAMN04515674_11496 [Pseudarcicella hirudinis]|uniref:Outer membrane protein beta-barrel domain-containing protein n=1 Tax=Pseudarcicella hirudinis TaxID=1079859 RepID=A0A1I5XEK3_9BACT|nr:hypothetical protein [Pseudarcicella hirudinis]SFQ30395.1 hypothetical protein SAMN04515674_11496 [Pseudarcicella hirudinis]